MTLIVVDFKATCSDKNEFPRNQMEIIEIGATALNDNFDIIDKYQTFIKPVRIPILTEFCKQLTTIEQSQVDSAPSFADVLEQFKKWIWSHENPVFSSWGAYDKKQLHSDCEYHRLPFPFNGEHINIKIEFSKYKNTTKKFGVGPALRESGLKFEGTPHRGIDDAINISRLAKLIFSKKQ